jgi:molybdate transport system substrate-binding protein
MAKARESGRAMPSTPSRYGSGEVMQNVLSRLRRVGIFACLVALLGAAPAASARDLLLFAAISMKDVLDEIVHACDPGSGVRVLTAYASSSALARQIEQGAPADVYVSADLDWMDHLAKRRLIDASSRIVLASNRLVLVAAADRDIAVDIAPGFPLARLLGGGRLAIANPQHVPAGRYARAALSSLGVWNAVRDQLAPADNVRVALNFVARGEAPLGIVYRTDARAEKRVRIAGVFPEGSHPEIRYPAAVVAASTQPEDARRLLTHLESASAAAAFERYGFLPAP